MIKGVNKNIIEIKNPDSLYFEKAVLYVRPNVTIFPETLRRKESERLLRSILPDPRIRKKRKLRKYIISAAIVKLSLLLLQLMR